MVLDGAAAFVISIDLEMSWGAVHHGSPHDRSPYLEERRVVAELLEVMEEYEISATWAVVGHLFLPRCGQSTGMKHPEIVRPDYSWFAGDWYDLDPGTSLTDDPTWYGPDLVARIRESHIPHELASHSFGHVIAGDEGCTEEAFRSDLEACLSAAAESGLNLMSYVFPRNSIGHLGLLAEAGFLAYRSHTPDRFTQMSPPLKKMALAMDRVRPLRSGAFRPEIKGDLVAIPQTYLFNPGSKTADRLGDELWGRVVRRRLRGAVRTSSLFHMWFHSHNLAGHPRRSRRAFEVLFEEARKGIDEGLLENLTMSDLAQRVRRHEHQA